MDYRQRVSRHERRQGGIPHKGVIIAAIIIALAILLYFKFHDHKTQKSAPVAVVARPIPPANLTALADSLILRCCESFGLSDTAFMDSYQSQNPGPGFHRFRQGWPAELPSIVFVQRLNKMATQRDLQCDCRESLKQGWLECSLKYGRVVGAQAILDCGRNSKLVGREMAIILDSLGAMKQDDIVKLIRNGVVFSYFGTNDFYPTGDLAKLFSRGNITSILKVAGNNEGLRNLGKSGWQNQSGNKKGKSATIDKSMSTGMLSHHPGAKAIVLDAIAGADSKVVKAILAEARHAKLAYLLSLNNPTPADRIALDAGLPLIQLNLETSDKDLTQFKFDLMSQLLSENSPHQIAICLNARNLDPDVVFTFKSQLEKVGVKFRPFMKLAIKVDTL